MKTLKDIIDSVVIESSPGVTDARNNVVSFKKKKSKSNTKKSSVKVDDAIKKMWEIRVFDEISKINERIDDLQKENDHLKIELKDSLKQTENSIRNAIESRSDTNKRTTFVPSSTDRAPPTSVSDDSLKVLNSPKMCVYTCIIGEYDSLKPVLFKDPRIDYICFVDIERQCYQNLGWKIRKIDFDFDAPAGAFAQRRIKILPHLFLSEYDISVWVDGTFQIVGDVYSMIDNIISRNSQKVCFMRKHPERDCIYQEAEAVKKFNKADPTIIDQQISAYRKDKFPEHFGLSETGIIIRKHNDPDCKELMNMWFDELLKYTYRDQMCFYYCIWKLNFVKFEWLDLMQDKFFNGVIESKNKHNKKVDIYITNFNTTDLVNLLIRSIIKNVRSLRYRIMVVDNSTLEKFSLDKSIDLEGHSVKVLDNTGKKLFDTDMLIKRYSRVESNNNYASLRHAIAIQWILDTAENDVILLDSDVVIKRDIDFIGDKYFTVADVGCNAVNIRRFLPFIQYFDIKKIREYRLRYLDIDRMHGGRNAENSKKYDTGASFYEDVIRKKIPYKVINHNVYIDHLKGGSWMGKDKEEFIKKESVYGTR